jgi:hypothetical protein
LQVIAANDKPVGATDVKFLLTQSVKRNLTYTERARHDVPVSADSRNTLRAHAHALSDLGKACTDLAAEHRSAANAVERNREKITYDRHFRQWILRVGELSAIAEHLLALQVELARSFGVTWEEVGAALGVSRQAAWDRFASHERWQKSRRITQLRNARAAPRRQAAVLLKVRDQVDGSRAELHALQQWLDERPPRTQP